MLPISISADKSTIFTIQKKILTNTTLTHQEITYLIQKSKTILLLQQHPYTIQEPIHIIGTLLGSLEDLKLIFDRVGYPPTQSYLFLGNYTGFEKNNFQLFLYLLTLKIIYPELVHLLRSCYECKQISYSLNLDQEIVNQYGNKFFFEEITNLYKYLKFYAKLNKSDLLCMSGGPTKDIKNI